MRLAELQHALQQRILSGDQAIETAIASDARIDVALRLGIYQNAYVVRLVEALGKTYTALRLQLGAEAFDGTAADFVRATPSVHTSIRYYGRELGGYVRRRWPGLEGQTLGELADWEWLLAEVFDAADATPLATDRLQGLAAAQWAALCFIPHPSLRRIRTTTSSVDLWRVASGAAEGRNVPEARPPAEWRVWRSGLRTLFRSMPPDETAALDALLRGDSFAGICEHIARFAGTDAAPARAAGLLATWIAEGLILDLRVAG